MSSLSIKSNDWLAGWPGTESVYGRSRRSFYIELFNVCWLDFRDDKLQFCLVTAASWSALISELPALSFLAHMSRLDISENGLHYWSRVGHQEYLLHDNVHCSLSQKKVIEKSAGQVCSLKTISNLHCVS